MHKETTQENVINKVWRSFYQVLSLSAPNKPVFYENTVNGIHLSDETLRNFRAAVFPRKRNASEISLAVPNSRLHSCATEDTWFEFLRSLPTPPPPTHNWVWETSILPWPLAHTHLLAVEEEYCSVNVWQIWMSVEDSADVSILSVPTWDLWALLGHTGIKLWLLLQCPSAFWICFLQGAQGFFLCDLSVLLSAYGICLHNWVIVLLLFPFTLT